MLVVELGGVSAAPAAAAATIVVAAVVVAAVVFVLDLAGVAVRVRVVAQALALVAVIAVEVVVETVVIARRAAARAEAALVVVAAAVVAVAVVVRADEVVGDAVAVDVLSAVDSADTCVHAICAPVSKQLQRPEDGGDELQPCVKASDPKLSETIAIVRRMVLLCRQGRRRLKRRRPDAISATWRLPWPRLAPPRASAGAAACRPRWWA